LGHNHSHGLPPLPQTTEDQERYKVMRNVTIVGAAVNVLLAVLKIVFGIIGQSQSLVADGVHSVSDLITDVMVVIAAKHSSRDADSCHPYGHGRIETVFTVALGGFLLVVAGGIAIDAVMRIVEPEQLLHPTPITLVVAAFSILANEGLYHYTVRIGNKIRSPMLVANAWHHRTDAISSVIVLVGIGGSLYGIEYLDALAAAGVAVLIAKIAWSLTAQGLRELVDTALDPEQVKEIERVIQKVYGVKEMHMLRTRKMGSDALVDVHIQVDPMLSVSEGHFISESVRAALIKHIEDVSDVTVHIDPENDETQQSCKHLPDRRTVIERLQQQWSHLEPAKSIQRITLHYLDGKIDVEVLLPLNNMSQNERESFAQSLRQIAHNSNDIANIRVIYL